MKNGEEIRDGRQDTPSLAEHARTLFHAEKVGSLATMAKTAPGFPFLSVAPFAATDDGQPLFLFSSLAQHTRNLAADPKASFLVSQPGADGTALSGQRATMVGEATILDEPTDSLRERYLDTHPDSVGWIDFGDFAFYQLNVERVYYVGGFGTMGWIASADYLTATADPLTHSAAMIIAHMNEDHADALILYARAYCGFAAKQATMTGVDRLGFDVLAFDTEGSRQLRIPFRDEVRTPTDARKALVAMVQHARQVADDPTG